LSQNLSGPSILASGLSAGDDPPPFPAPVSTIPSPQPSPPPAPVKPAATKPVAVVAPPPPPSLIAQRSMMAPPDSGAGKLFEPTPEAGTPPAKFASNAPAPEPDSSEATPLVPVPRTEFGVDLGGANSIDGLRLLWQRLSKSSKIAGLRPIIVLKERANGLGMQLRLVAGPLGDAAAAARLCATLTEQSCETSVFDGQRLPIAASTPGNTRPAPRAQHRRTSVLIPRVEEPVVPAPAPEAAPAKPTPLTTLTAILGMR
jgi:hypothetical protein